MSLVVKATEFLAITRASIGDIKITKKVVVQPFQICKMIDVTLVNYTFEVNAMSAEKYLSSFLLSLP